MNAGGKKAVLWGTALDNLVSWRMVTPDGRVARGHAHRSQSGQDPRRCASRRSNARGSPRRQDRDPARNACRFPAPRFARRASARTSPTSSCGPAGHPEGRLRRPHHQRALHPAPDAAGDPHGVPRVLRSGARVDARDRRDQGLPRRAAEGGTRARDARRPRASRRALREGRRLRDQGEAPRPAEDGAARRHRRRRRRRRRARRRSEVVRIANARGAEGFVAVSAEARKKFWLDRARTAAIAKHTNAFKINEDVVIPLPRLGDYTDGIERINIELSIGNKLALCDALARVPGSADRRSWPPGSDERPAQDDRRRQGGRGARADRGDAPNVAATSSTASTRRFRRCRSTRSSCRGSASSRRRSRRSSRASPSRR